MEGVSSPQPEELRQQVDDSPSSTLSQNGEDVRDYQSEPSSENITLPEEEVLQSDHGPAFEETESPGLDFEFVHDVDAIRRKYQSLLKVLIANTTGFGEVNGFRRILKPPLKIV